MKDLRKIYILISFLTLCIITGPVIKAQNGDDKNTYISLGLLVNKQNEAAATCGAGLAVKQINDQGGVKGKPLKLIIRSVEGAWGAGSSEVVDLVFKEKVTAIVGSIDGRNSHLAEQVIAKTQVTYLSVWASDPSLSKAYVPWYFSLVPTDDQQATLLLEEVSVKKRFQNILVVNDQTYDAEQALKSFFEASNGIENLNIFSITYPSSGSKDLKSRIENNKLDAIILLGRQIPISDFLKQHGVSGKTIPVYTNLAAQASENYFSNQFETKDQFKEVTSGSWMRSDADDFQKAFFTKCKVRSGPVAAYAYDGIMMVSEALKQSGNDRESLQKHMSQINYQGVTGTVQFDSQGRLKNTGKLLLIRE